MQTDRVRRVAEHIRNLPPLDVVENEEGIEIITMTDGPVYNHSPLRTLVDQDGKEIDRLADWSIKKGIACNWRGWTIKLFPDDAMKAIEPGRRKTYPARAAPKILGLDFSLTDIIEQDWNFSASETADRLCRIADWYEDQTTCELRKFARYMRNERGDSLGARLNLLYRCGLGMKAVAFASETFGLSLQDAHNLLTGFWNGVSYYPGGWEGALEFDQEFAAKEIERLALKKLSSLTCNQAPNGA